MNLESALLFAALDDDERADEALRAGLELERALDGTCRWIHAVHAPHWNDYVVDEAQRAALFARAVGEAHEALAAALRDRHPEWDTGATPITDRVHVFAGKPSDVLVDEALREGADLIVIGPHRRHGILDFGSTARDLLAHAPCPVWIQSGPWREPSRILVPVDFSPGSRRALAIARDLASVHGARLVVVHAFETPDFAFTPERDFPGPTYVVDSYRDAARSRLRALEAEFDWGAVEHETRFLEGRPVEEILRLQNEVDLLVLSTHGRTGLARMAFGNVAYQIAKRADVAVLAARV